MYLDKGSRIMSEDYSVILEVKGLKKVFKEDLLRKAITAVSHVDCRFVSGTINTIIGHNGAGKTTTLRIILGLLQADEGEIFFKGQPLKIQDRRSIGYMPEIHRLSGLLTPYETLWAHLLYYPAAHRGRSERKRLVESHLRKLEVWPHRQKKVRELSKGLQRRLAYCLAVIHEPEFLILDEPFAGLDPLGREMMESWLLEEKAKNHTIIMSSHDVDAMTQLCDYYHVFNQGKSVYSSLDDQEGSKLTPRYELKVSGLKKETLKGYLAEEPSFVAPDLWSSQGYAHRLVYPGYESALQVLKFLLPKGVLVSSFESLGLIEKDKILNYFREPKDHHPQEVTMQQEKKVEEKGKDEGGEESSESREVSSDTGEES